MTNSKNQKNPEVSPANKKSAGSLTKQNLNTESKPTLYSPSKVKLEIAEVDEKEEFKRGNEKKEKKVVKKKKEDKKKLSELIRVYDL